MEFRGRRAVKTHYDNIINSYPEALKELFENIICGIVKIDDEGYLRVDSCDDSFLCYLNKCNDRYSLNKDCLAKFYVYGVWQYISNDDKVWAHKIFSICYKLMPRYESLCHCIRGMLSSNEASLPEVVEMLSSFEKAKGQFFKKNKQINLIWFLLAYICVDFSCDIIRDKKISNFSCADINYAPDNSLITKIIDGVYDYDFLAYFRDKKGVYDHYGNCSPFYELLLVLVDLCHERKKKLREKLFEFIKAKDYVKLVELLERNSASRHMTDEEQCLLLVGRELVRLSNSSNQPARPSIISKSFVVERQSFGFHTIKRVIEENDFVYAYDTYERFCADKHINKDENFLYLMLRDLNDLIVSKNNDEKVSSVDSSCLVVTALEIKASGRDFEEVCEDSSLSPSDKMKVKLFLVREYYHDALELYYLSRDMNGYLPAVYWFRKYWDTANEMYVEVEKILSEYPGDYEDVRALINELKRLPDSFDILENENDKLRLRLK